MDAIELNRKGLEDTLATLIRCSTDFGGQYREILAPVVQQYKVLYFKLTGENYLQRHDYLGAAAKPPILPKEAADRRPHVVD